MKQVIGILMMIAGVGLILLDFLNLLLMIPGMIKVFSGPDSQAYAMGYVVGGIFAFLVFAFISLALIFFGRRLSKSPQPNYPTYPPRPY